MGYFDGLQFPRMDFSYLSDIGKTIGGTIEQRQLANDMQSAIKPDGTYDYGKMIAVLSRHNPMAAAKFASDHEALQGLTNYRSGVLANQAENAKSDFTAATEYWEKNRPQPAPMNIGPTDSGVPGISLYSQPQGLDQSLIGAPAAVQKQLVPENVQAGWNKGAEKEIETKFEKPDDWAKAQQLTTFIQDLEGSADALLSTDIQGLRNLTGNWNVNDVDTGIPSQYVPNWKGETRDAQALLDGMTSKIVLQQMQNLKQLSAQGATGLGSTSEKEIDLLANAYANLSTAQTFEQMQEALKKIKFHSQRVRELTAGKFQMKHNERFTPEMNAEPAAPTPNSDPDLPPETIDGKPVTKDPYGSYLNPEPGSKSALIQNVKRAVSTGVMTVQQAIQLLESRGVKLDHGR